MPITADSSVETPTSAIVGPALLAISSATGWLVVYVRPRFSDAVCFM
jgi:hypothetical protein